MINKLMVSALFLSTATFLTSSASAGFDKEGNLTLRSSTLKRAAEAGKKDKCFWVRDAAGTKKRFLITQFKGRDRLDSSWIKPNQLAEGQKQVDGTFRLKGTIYPEDNQGGNTRLETLEHYNLVLSEAPRGFNKDGALLMTVRDLEKAYNRKKGIRVYDDSDGTRKRLKIVKDSQPIRAGFNLLQAPEMILTAETQADGSYRFIYSSPAWITPQNNTYLAGTEFLDLKATVVETKLK